MDKISVITPPDKLFNKAYNFLLIYPTEFIKNELQNIIASWDTAINIYVYEPADWEQDVDWLLSMHKMADTVILCVDNTPPRIHDLNSYFVSYSNTYWLTNGDDLLYNKLSLNRIYNLDELSNTVGGNFEKN